MTDLLKEFPFMEYPDAIAGLVRYQGPALGLMSFKKAAATDKERLVVVCTAEHIASALHDGIVTVSLVDAGDTFQGRPYRTNMYHPKPAAVAHWTEHTDKSNADVLALWKAKH